jgi:hypothetical protein
MTGHLGRIVRKLKTGKKATAFRGAFERPGPVFGIGSLFRLRSLGWLAKKKKKKKKAFWISQERERSRKGIFVDHEPTGAQF